MNKMFKKAFTLSEVLIALAVIGIIAAITVPSVSIYMQNLHLQSQFKKVYSELAQLARIFYSDNGNISVSDYAYENGLSSTITKLSYYLKEAVLLTSSGQGTSNSEGVYEAFYPIKTLNGQQYSGGANSTGKNSSFLCDNSGFKMTLSGAIFLFNDAPSAENINGPVICVDINGQKGPNTYGKDYFLFLFTTDGNLIPMGMEYNNNPGSCGSSSGSCSNFANIGSQYCSKSNNSIAYNTSCAYYALADKHPTQSGKTYWKDFL